MGEQSEQEYQEMLMAAEMAQAFMLAITMGGNDTVLPGCWLALPLATKEPSVMVHYHATPLQLIRRAVNIEAINQVALRCPFMKLQVQACPDCLAGKPCRGRKFLKELPLLKLRIKKVLRRWIPQEAMVFLQTDGMYGVGRPHLVNVIIHGNAVDPQLYPVTTRAEQVLKANFPDYEIKISWCPDCTQGHDEQHFAA